LTIFQHPIGCQLLAWFVIEFGMFHVENKLVFAFLQNRVLKYNSSIICKFLLYVCLINMGTCMCKLIIAILKLHYRKLKYDQQWKSTRTKLDLIKACQHESSVIACNSWVVYTRALIDTTAREFFWTYSPWVNCHRSNQIYQHAASISSLVPTLGIDFEHKFKSI
jgi:hypothetical protein